MLAVKVHRANLHDTKAGIFPAIAAYRRYPTIKKFCGDKGYRKTFVMNVKTILGLDTDISEKIVPHGFEILPKRWVVERTFAWLNNSRRLSKDYEILVSSSEAMIKISHWHTLLNRL
jgi:putative transposase